MDLPKSLLDRLWSQSPDTLRQAIAASSGEVLKAYEINTKLRLAHFMAQVSHESAAGTHLEEDLNYRAERLMDVWPSRFPTIESAAPYAHNPEKLALHVYGDRMGNRPGTDDAWVYRGRGLIQLTGRKAYADQGISSAPEMASDPEHCFGIAAGYWSMRGLNAYADDDDTTGITRAINGGLVGLATRLVWLERWKRALS